MKHLCARTAARLALILCCLTLPASILWAQNENEAVGFQTNHIFESGQFGENIDALNGGLNLTIPIGPKYQVNSHLGYQLTLSYSSKVWDAGNYKKDDVLDAQEVMPYNESPFGIGFTLHLGRIFQDAVKSNKCKWRNGDPCWMLSWKWVSLDGNHHEFHFTDGSPDALPNQGPFHFNNVMTADQSYVMVSGPTDDYCYPSTEGQCYKVKTPDGLIYTLSKRNTCFAESAESNDRNKPMDQAAQDARRRSLSFCGWYTTLIEDPSVGSQDIVTGTDGRPKIGTPYPNHVRVTYDARDGLKHLITEIRDSADRVVTFDNCEWTEGANANLDQPGLAECKATPSATPTPSDVAISAIHLPAVGGTTATYDFVYQLSDVIRANMDYEDEPVPLMNGDSVLKLLRVDYPDVPGDQYSMYFGYSNSQEPLGKTGDKGEVTCRTLPIRRISGHACAQGGVSSGVTRFTYDNWYYRYTAEYMTGGMNQGKRNMDNTLNPPSGSPLGTPTTAFTRGVIRKNLQLTAGTTFASWEYTRTPPSFLTNPPKVTVTDPFGNETVYHYHASASTGSLDPEKDGTNPDDGYAPDWRDGMNYQIDYYEGPETGGRLVRQTFQDYDADRQVGFTEKHTKKNIRVQRTVTRHHDDGERESVVARDDWDGRGNWRIETESGFDVALPRITRRAYVGAPLVYRTDLMSVQEVSDGAKVLSRTDNGYNDKGQLEVSIARATLPGSMGTPQNLTQQPGDVKTIYTYSPRSGNVMSKVITTSPSGSGYWINYTYGPTPSACAGAPGECGGYLATKEFRNPDGSAPPQQWKAIDRTREPQTGLIVSSRDPSGVQTDYSYDSLGRITEIRPAGETTTFIAYPSLKETTVTQGDIFARYKYDSLGRLVVTQKRTADATGRYACQRSQYDIANHAVYKTESSYRLESDCEPFAPPVGSSCWASVDFAANPGTESSLKDPTPASTSCDPFGRVRELIPADADRATKEKTTRTDYFGTSSTVTVKGVRGAGGVAFDSVTTFYKDALGRLIHVYPPATDGGASAHYAYDAADKLIQVDLMDINAYVQTRRFGYDGLGRIKWADNPESGTMVNGDYDGLGNLLWLQDAKGNQQRFTFDFAGRPKQQTVVPADGGGPKVVLDNLFDETGRGQSLGKLTTVKSYDEAGALILTEQRSYNEIGGRLSALTHGFADWDRSEITSYAYNSLGLVTSITYPLESTPRHSTLLVDYEYVSGFVTRATERAAEGRAATVLGTVTYNAAGAVESVDMGAAGRNVITFDPKRNRPQSITGGVWNAQTSKWTYESGNYEYDGAGNIYQIGSNSYGYDSANRLISVHTDYTTPTSSNTYDEQFTYDAFGNLTRRIITNAPSSITETDDFGLDNPPVVRTNRVLYRDTTTNSGTYTGDAGLLLFSYDLNGNLTQGGRRWYPAPGPGGPGPLVQDVKKYEYGVLNRLLKVHNVANEADGTQLSEIDSFAYGADGNRIRKLESASGLKTYYVRDGTGQVLSEFRLVTSTAAAAPEWTKDYVYLAGRLLTMKENLRPEPARGLRATQDINDLGNWIVMLTWQQNTEPDRAGYKVYRKREGIDADFVLRASPSSPQFTDAGLPGGHPAGRVILYRVSCKDTSGNESEKSAILRVVAGDSTRPTTPILTGAPGDRRVTLTFSSADAAGIVGYYIYRGPSPNSLPLLTSQLVTDSRYTDVNLTNDTSYYYRVQALDTSGNASDLSCQPQGGCPLEAMPKDFAPPIPPRGLTVTSACGAPTDPEQIHIAWEANPGTDSVLRYELYRNTTPDFTGLLPYQTKSPSETSTDDPAVAPNTTYYYALKAVDTSLNISAFSDTRARSTRDPSVWSETSQVRPYSTASDGSVRLVWKAPTGRTPNKYLVYRKPNAAQGCGYYVYAGETTQAEFTDAAVLNNQAYDYAVTVQLLEPGGAVRESSFARPTLAIPVARPPFNQRQCYRDPGGNDIRTVLQWTPPSGRPYQPIFGTTGEGGFLGYLKGYHLYHHKVCSHSHELEDFQDDSPMREIVVGTSNMSQSDPVDPYIISSGGASGGQGYVTWDARLEINDSTPMSPAALIPGEQAGVFIDCGGANGGAVRDNDANCALPRAVYKVYAEGTWLTVESDWPEYWDRNNVDPVSRCRKALKWHGRLPECTDQAANPNYIPPPQNVRRDSSAEAAPGEITIRWDAPAPRAGVEIAGYYVYVREGDNALEYNPTSSFQPPLPVVTKGPADRHATLTGLRAGLYRFNVASFDQAGRMSEAVGSSLSNDLWVSPGAETESPRPPRALKTILWTINDSTHKEIVGGSTVYSNFPRGRSGIKIAWQWTRSLSGLPDTGLLGYRVYRSETADGQYCALLKPGTPTDPNPDIPVCPDANAYSTQYTTGPIATDPDPTDPDTVKVSNTFYWDRTVASDRVYHYRVTQVLSSGGESALSASDVVSGKALPYDVDRLPPPTGFRAWAPWTAEKAGIYLRWCAYPPARDLPTPLAYKIYRSNTPGGPYEGLRRVSPACLDGDKRCVITPLLPGETEDTVVLPASCNGSTVPCAIVDDTLPHTSTWYPSISSPSPNPFSSLYYVVTGISVGSGGVETESMPSFENAGWLNYLDGSTWSARRDPDGSGEKLICGDEVSQIDRREMGILNEEETNLQRQKGAFADSTTVPFMAPHRTIGQACPINPAGSYSPPARFVFYHLDHLGSTRVITGACGSVESQHHYLPFGEERPSQVDNTLNTRAFTGHERDDENGLDYMMARYYGASFARFLAVDPMTLHSDRLSDPQRLNLYSYAANNPIKYVDPTGRDVAVGNRGVDWIPGYNHAFIIVKPTGANVQKYKTRIDPKTGTITLSGFKEGRKLVKKENADAGRAEQTIQLRAPKGTSMEQFETNVIEAYDSYNGKATYQELPGSEGYNSNSLASGILDAAGAQDKPTTGELEGNNAGWTSPVPLPDATANDPKNPNGKSPDGRGIFFSDENRAAQDAKWNNAKSDRSRR